MSNGLMVRLVGNRSHSPGPAAYSTRRRPGSESPAWTIKNRYKQKIEAIDAEYVNLESTIGRGPKISMKSRHDSLPKIDTPGPNYIPKNFGSETTPIHVSPRYGDRKTESTPGPGQYTPRDAPSTARVSIRNRTKLPESNVDSPGPAGYSPDYKATRRSSRSPTIGRRASEPKKQITPGPSDYQISRDITNGQGILMHIRPRESGIAVTPGPSDYGSPNNPANFNSPSYTIGHRYDQKTDTNQAGFVNLPSTVGQGPKISMSSRHEARDVEATPGPNYVPPSMAQSARGISIGSRSPDGKIEVTPGPGQYNTLNKSGVDGVTPITIKGRTPLPGAGTDSPGPAGYNPDYDATRKSSPSPTIGRRGIDPKVEVTPGPSDYAISRDITNGQGISMHIRPREGDIAVTPGPSDYGNPNNPSSSNSPSYTIGHRYEQKTDTNQAGFVNLPSTVGQGPKISMSSRHEARDVEPTPGPNYVPPSLAESSRGVTIGHRSPDGKTEITPGPGQYDTLNKSGVDGVTPITIKGRNYMPETSVDSPGPAGYSPDYNSTRRGSPSPTIGRRGIDPKIPVTPGPSDYEISRDITNGGQGISMHIRPREGDIAVTPGPSDYGNPNNPANSNSPSFTIGHRYEQKTDTNQAGFVNLPSTVGQGPKISMSSRHEARDLEPTPGPNYVPPSLAESSRGVTIGSRSPDGKIEVTPGPGQYNTLNKSGVDGVTPITIKGRTPLPGAGTDSPGPAGYNPDYDATRKSSPSPTIGRRGIDPKVEVTPGPSDYAISRDITNGQGISMHIRPREGDIAVTPGPSDYGNPNNPSSSNSPSYTIGHRYEQKTDTNQAGFVNLPSTVGQGPKISMSSRHEARDVEPTPGPNYVPPSLAESSRGITIGNRSPDGKTEITPGPGQYNTLNKSGVDGVTPITIKGRNYMPETSVDSPGPAGYNPDYDATRKSSPSPTIGRRGIDPKIPVTPGPSDYEISRDITNGGQGISMHIRPREGGIAVTPGPSDYGNLNNPANSNSPSFTIGHRYEQKTDTNQAGFVNLPSTVGQGPKISMSSRHETRDAEPTPGPNYVPPSLAESSRGVTIGHRSPDGKTEITPGPGQYDTLNKSGVDGVTPITIKGRTPLPGAGTDSPGPAGYNPDYAATRKSSPSPTIGRRGIDPKIPVTPGPSDYEISRDITNGGQGISMHIRPREGDIAVTPGPSDYGNPNNPANSNSPSFTIGHRYEQKTDTNQAGFVNLPSTVGQGPKISMSSRHEARDLEPTPGPNYVPPSLAESSRGVTIGSRSPDGKIEVTPGPGQYNTLNKSGVDGVTPITIKGRTPLPGAGTDSPGPAGYNPDYDATRKSSPSPTIGRRGIDPKVEVTPGPSDYAISRDITNGQGISMHIRPREGDIAVTPGPSDYGNPNNPSSSNSPSYTIGHRYEQKTDTNQAGFVNLPSTVGQGPKISMSSRHEARDAEPTPGPNYVPPSLGGKGITIGNRTPDGKTEVTPGPGQYNTLNSSGVDGVAPITIKGRNYLPTTTSESPGPAAYYLMYNPKLDSKGITIGLKYPEKSPESTPGFYDIPSTRGGPAFTIGNREECDVAIL